jgi:hypothetical protein
MAIAAELETVESLPQTVGAVVAGDGRPEWIKLAANCWFDDKRGNADVVVLPSPSS